MQGLSVNVCTPAKYPAGHHTPVHRSTLLKAGIGGLLVRGTDIKMSMLSEQDAGKPAAAALQSYSSMQKHSPMTNVSTGPGKEVAFNTSSEITLKM